MKNREKLNPSIWLQILTKAIITAEEIAIAEDCNIKTARKIAMELSGSKHVKGTPYTCKTDDYLEKYKCTSRKAELRLIYARN